jgi:hypothetical protein
VRINISRATKQITPSFLLSKLPFSLLIIATTLLAFTTFNSEGLILKITQGEESFVEILTAFLFFFAFVTFYKSLKKVKKVSRIQIVHSRSWIVITFLAFGEETSWLQHVLGYETPEFLSSLNSQGELNLHNIIQSRNLIFYLQDGFDWSFFGAQNLFTLFFFVYFLLIPLVIDIFQTKTPTALPKKNYITSFPRLTLPSYKLYGMVLLLSYILTLVNYESEIITTSIAEIRELIFSIAIFHLSILQYKSEPERDSSVSLTRADSNRVTHDRH